MTFPDLSRKPLLSMAVMMAVALPVTFGLVPATQVRAQSASAKPAVNIAGAWQGTLAWAAGANYPAGQLRVMLKIAREGDAGWSAQYFYVDQSGRPRAALDVTLQESRLQYRMPEDGAHFDGTVSADGGSIVGRWISSTAQNPITFVRTTPETAWVIPPPPPRMPPMAADADPAFEVATIKPSLPEEHGPSLGIQGRQFSFVQVSMYSLFDFAYGLQQREIVGAPDWFESERYTISGVPDSEGEPSVKQWQAMVKKLMANRFQLKFHYEKRELSVYELTLVKIGPQLKRDDSSAPGGLRGGPGGLRATNQTMADIAQFLGHGFLDRPAVDQTGLEGKFDLSMRWTPDEPQPAPQSADAPPDFFTAIQEQLGLKLVPTKASVDILVIDHIERPSGN